METFIAEGTIVGKWEDMILELAKKHDSKYKTLKYKSFIRTPRKYTGKPLREGLTYKYYVTDKEMDKDA